MKVTAQIYQALQDCVKRWANLEKENKAVLGDWKDRVYDDILKRVTMLEKYPTTKYRPFLSSSEGKEALTGLHQDFVIVPTDKAGNNFTIVCEKFYIEQSMRELGIFLDTKNSNPTYELVKVSLVDIINRHKRYLKRKLG